MTKKRYASWRDIQDEHEGYMASLGPWTVAEVVEFLEFEYPDLRPIASRVHALAVSDAETVEL